MSDRENVNFKARTIVEITGSAIETIPKGTEFIITWLNPDPDRYSACEGLSITEIWNCEYELCL